MSIDETYIRMMNEEIDGVISDGDAEKLASYVRSDPEAGIYYAELRATVMAIDDAKDVEPPPEMRQRIFDSVFGRPQEEAVTSSSRGRSFWQSFAPVFVAGVAAGFILFAVIRQLPDTTKEDPGYGATIGAAQNDQENTEKFDAHGVNGSISPLFESGSITVTIEIASEVDASILLEFGEGASFESITSDEGAAYQMEVDEKSLLLVHQGKAEYVARFRSAASPAVVVRIFTDGKTVAAMEFSTEE